jgi:hypothetical protein
MKVKSVGAAVLLLVSVSAFAAPPDVKPSPDTPVSVTNTTASPVPVTGSVSVTGSVTGTVTGTVGLAPGTSVMIDSTVGDPVRVRNVNDAIQPVHASTSCLATTIGCLPTIYTVPAGKRLVIEYASMSVCILPGQSATLGVTTTTGGKTVTHFLNGTPPAVGPGTFAIGCNGALPSSSVATGQQVKIYADAGSSVFLEADRSNTVGNAGFSISISGYLVDVPLTP